MRLFCWSMSRKKKDILPSAFGDVLANLPKASKGGASVLQKKIQKPINTLEQFLEKYHQKVVNIHRSLQEQHQKPAFPAPKVHLIFHHEMFGKDLPLMVSPFYLL
jgi:hypothetical protein